MPMQTIGKHVRLFVAAATALAAFVASVQPLAAQNAAPPPPSLGAVISQVPPDLWHFLSWDTAAVLGIGGGAAALGHIWDDDLAGELETNVRLNDAMAPGNTYGAFSMQAVIGVGLYTGGWLAKK